MSAERVYICHTWYHAYIACVKELLSEGEGGADLILSTMSNDFGNLRERLAGRGVFREIFMYDEQSGDGDERLKALHRDRGNLVLNLMQRIRYTRLLGKLQEDYIPTDLSVYREVNVFCDSDPIGYFLNYRKIPYHAIEDGLNSGKLDNQARLSNLGAWGLKKFMARLGLIFIECGYSRYCIDYEVNDISVNFDPPPNSVEVPRDEMYAKLTREDHRFLADTFLPDPEGLRTLMSGGRRKVMILTEPLCALGVRERLFADIVERYTGDYDVIIKPHPRDELDYETTFSGKYPGISVMTGCFPMEALDDMEEFHIDRLVSVITQVDNVKFAEHVDYLGLDFLDRYEDPSVHRKMENLTGRVSDGSSVAGDNASGGAGDRLADSLDRRAAKPGDSKWWLSLRNDESVRAASLNTELIDEATHERWFAGKLTDANERLFVYELDGDPAAQLRLSRERDGVYISYAVEKKFWGHRIGAKLLGDAVELAQEEFKDGLLVIGIVKEDNIASAKAFESVGYRLTEKKDGTRRYELLGQRAFEK